MTAQNGKVVAEAACTQLAEQGYCVLDNVLDREAIERLSCDLSGQFAQTPFCDGDFYGRSTKRFGGLLRHSAHAAALIRHPLVLTNAQRVLGPWCDRIILNLTQAIEIHPGALAQHPQRDQRSEEHTSELQSLMRTSNAVFC